MAQMWAHKIALKKDNRAAVLFRPIVRPHFCAMTNPIREWLNDGKWFVGGLALLRQLGGDTADLERYSSGGFVPPNYAQLLETRLRALEHAVTENQQAHQALDHERGGNYLTDMPREPAYIQSLRERAKYLHKRESAIHAEMRLSNDKKHRYACAGEIMRDIRPVLDDIYEQIRTWESTGTLQTTEGNTDTGNDLRRLLNLRSRISKIKSLLAVAMPEKRRKMLEWELEEKQLIVTKLEENGG